MTGGLIGFDRVLRHDPGREAVAIRNIPGTLDVFDSHFPRFPVLPGVLLLDSIAQLAGYALGGPAGGWTLSGAEALRFRHFIQPGDQVQITVTVLEPAAPASGRPTAPGATGSCSARVDVDGRTVATARRIHLLATPPAPFEGVLK